jgi:hypothetical protein
MRKNFVWPMVCMSMIFTIALFGCGGGGTSNAISGAVVPDTMTVTISGPSGTVTKTYTKGSYDTQGHLNPDMISYVSPSNTTIIELADVSTTQVDRVDIVVFGTTPQSYPIDSSNSLLTAVYVNNVYTSMFSSPSGTVTLSSIGNVGEKINGTFDATVTSDTNASDTLKISGTFSVTRGS